MPHQYGLHGFEQTPPSPPSQHGALLPRIGGGAVVPGSTGGSMTTSTATTVYRAQIEDKKLTKDAMERYMRERNDMVIVILHAKVNIIWEGTYVVSLFRLVTLESRHFTTSL